MRAAKVQASLRIRAVSPETSLLAHTSSESRGTFRQKARSLASLNGWACAVKICHDGMLEDTNSLDGAHISCRLREIVYCKRTLCCQNWILYSCLRLKLNRFTFSFVKNVKILSFWSWFVTSIVFLGDWIRFGWFNEAGCYCFGWAPWISLFYGLFSELSIMECCWPLDIRL